MKIRTGFVSNSSSSSFVFLTTLANHLLALSKIEERYRTIIEAITSKTKVFGQEMVKGSTWSTPGSSWEEDLDVDIEWTEDEDQFEIIYETYDKYIKELEKDKDNLFTHEVEM